MTTIKLKNGSGAPTAGDLVQGEPALDLTNKRLYTEDSGGTVIEVGTNPTSITTGDITATGTASFANLATTGNITFGDNDKAVFGAGSDLQIYHSGSHSFISEAGTGDLYIGASSNIALMNSAFSENKLLATTDGALKLYYDGSQKLSTTSTGIDVTGTVTADGISSSGDITITESTPSISFVDSDGTNQIGKLRQVADTVILSARNNTAYGNFKFTGEDGSTEKTRLQINGSTGDISFYEDTGTTAKLFWDASAESLGIGTSSPSGALDIGGQHILYDNYDALGASFTRNGAYGSVLSLGRQGVSSGVTLDYPADNTFALSTNSTERMRIDSSGNLLVSKTANNDSDAGVVLRATGEGSFVASGQRVAYFNRLSSDGEIITLRKDGTSVGSIGSQGGSNLYIEDADTGLRFSSSSDEIAPCGSTGANRDNAITLGAPNNRFKDLYLSGIIYGVQQTLTRDSGAPLELNRTTNDGELVYFKQSGIVRGSISISGSTTSYNTTSDYRLKENVVAMSGATERLKQLNPSRFNFIGDTDTTVDGFLAHEVADVVPEAITGAKDAVDDDGNAVYQGIDQSKLVPLLVATIQELEARIAALESN
jgi:hypothetical protein